MTATSLKVSPATRDRVKTFIDDENRTADQIINAALDQLERERRRRTMREQSRLGMLDPADQAAIADVRTDLDALRAW